MPDLDPSTHPHSGEPLIRVEGLTKTFDHGGRRLEVLRGINLTLATGEMVSVMGQSGAGKSTLLHILGTIDLPTGGALWFAGRDLRRMTSTQLAEFRNRSIGFVFQFHHLLPEFTALENVMMPALIQRLPREVAEHRASELLRTVGLTERVTHRPGELSGGEQQRVALARALVMQPRLLLADEPTGNLDSKTGAAIHDLFFSLNERYRTTIFVVTHNPELAARMPRQMQMVDGLIYEAADAPRPLDSPVAVGA
ncbi:MAG: ABC transporter ATP-binding protein [Deltaproteobacteria bacterium]|nr:ABC transporter ATP-binding protein [Deltaproteobacteria bacterium]